VYRPGERGGWYAWSTTGDLERKILLLLMAALYGLRLGLYILLNRVIGKDGMRAISISVVSGDRTSGIVIFGYFQLQAAAVALFSRLPFLVIMQNVFPPFSLWELAGFLIWLAAVVGEGFADWQLRAIPIQVVESRPGLSRWILAILTPSELFL